jgi:erythronate-4-phosphate dehydrogenase
LQSMGYRIVADENIQVTSALRSISDSLITLPGRDIAPAHLADADVLLVRSVTSVTEPLLAASPVTFVGSATAGVEHIDTEYLAARGIRFASAPGANANAVTEYVLSVLAARGRIAEVLQGGCVGIVGYGNVGRQLASTVVELGGVAVVWDPWQTVPLELSSPSLEFVLQQKIVTLHASLHEQSPWPSRAMVDTPLPENIPSGQLFINAARGELLTNAALDTLTARGSDIVLDVWPDEPAISASQMAAVSLGTPHIAGYTKCAKVAATNMLVHALNGTLAQADKGVQAPIDMTRHQGVSAATWLTQLLLMSYDPNVDTDALVKTCGTEVRGNDFDALRRDYALRRELRGRVVLMPTPHHAPLDRLVLALGATPSYAP